MNVKELKAALAIVNDDVEVIMADGEPVAFAQVVDGTLTISDRTGNEEEYQDDETCDCEFENGTCVKCGEPL